MRSTIVAEAIKQETYKLTLSQELTSLCENTAYLISGKASDAETLIKNAINFYIQHQKDEISPHIQDVEHTLNKRFDTLADNLQIFCEQRDSQLFNKLSALVLSCSFEAELTQLMLKDQYCRDRKSAARYEELRSFVIAKLRSQLDKNETTELQELRETVRLLQNRTANYENELQKIKVNRDELKKQLDKNSCEYVVLAQRYAEVVKNLEEYTRLVRWCERMVQEVPEIRRNNSGLIREQTWEGAVAEFIENNPRPEI